MTDFPPGCTNVENVLLEYRLNPAMSTAMSENPILRGKVIVVMGGTTGIGLSAAKACLAAGGHVLVVGRNEEHCEAARVHLGANALVFRGDAAQPETAVEAIGRAWRELGGLDGLYHVAGGSGRRYGDGPIHAIPDEGWRTTLQWNLDSVFFSNRAAINSWLDRGQPGSILNLSSVLANSPSPSFFATHAYATAKAGIIGLSKSIAAHYAPRNIRCNVIAPALVDTPMAQRAAGDPQIRAFIATKQPLDGGRLGLPTDLDAAAVFLLSDQSKYVTGQVLAVDGGWSISEGQVNPAAPNKAAGQK